VRHKPMAVNAASGLQSPGIGPRLVAGGLLITDCDARHQPVFTVVMAFTASRWPARWLSGLHASARLAGVTARSGSTPLASTNSRSSSAGAQPSAAASAMQKGRGVRRSLGAR
jgi:hypothetical protein